MRLEMCSTSGQLVSTASAMPPSTTLRKLPRPILGEGAQRAGGRSTPAVEGLSTMLAICRGSIREPPAPRRGSATGRHRPLTPADEHAQSVPRFGLREHSTCRSRRSVAVVEMSVRAISS